MAQTSLETVLRNKLKTINNLQAATYFIKHKSELDNVRIELKPIIDTIKIQISRLKQNYISMKEQNEEIEDLIEVLKFYDNKVSHMLTNFPATLNITERQNETLKKKSVEKKNTTIIDTQPANSDSIVDPSHYLPFQKDCRKTLFKDNDDAHTIEPLDTLEFSKIPKYMIGRQTLTQINDFVGTINKVLKAKYSLLSLGKVGARKKGEMDLYLQFKKEEADMYPDKEKKYFFTSEDYNRETKTKLDKMKLNILTVLRHCKRIKEVRIGKTVIYELIPS